MVNLEQPGRRWAKPTITPEVLQQGRLVTARSDLVKVLGNGELKTALTVHAHKFSKSAQEKITKARRQG